MSEYDILELLEKKMLCMTVWAIGLGACANNFACETAEINAEVEHLLLEIFYSKLE